MGAGVGPTPPWHRPPWDSPATVRSGSCSRAGGQFLGCAPEFLTRETELGN